MRKTGSLLYLTVAASFWRVLVILAGMAVVQLGVAVGIPKVLPESYGAPYVFSHLAFRFPAAAALILVMYTLIRSHGSRPTQTGYTMLRLPVSPTQVFLSYLVYAVAVLLLCWLQPPSCWPPCTPLLTGGNRCSSSPVFRAGMSTSCSPCWMGGVGPVPP